MQSQEGVNCMVDNTFQLPKEAQLFLETKKSDLSQNSIIQLGTTFKIFFSYCNKSLVLISYDDVLKWLEDYSPGKSDRTIICRLSNLRSLFGFCLSQKIISKIPIKNDWIPSVPDSLPKFLSELEYTKVMRVVDNLPLRDKTMLTLFYYSGIRCSELRNTTEKDINLDDRTLTVIGKGNIERDVDFNDVCKYLFKKLHPFPIEQDNAIFVSKYGEKISTRHIRRIVAKVGKRAGLEKNLSPHIFRHTYCCILMNKGADINFVATEMGHVDINTTEIYFRLQLSRLKEEYLKCME
jgi:integrase/recombinase XerD